MKYNDFIKSLKEKLPPNNISATMESMWHIKKGDWDIAHKIAQDITSDMGSWIHAHLHRIEGDKFNAEYWYRRANKTPFNIKLDDEANQIIMHILHSNKNDF